jgi:hypothetical protein
VVLERIIPRKWNSTILLLQETCLLDRTLRLFIVEDQSVVPRLFIACSCLSYAVVTALVYCMRYCNPRSFLKTPLISIGDISLPGRRCGARVNNSN